METDKTSTQPQRPYAHVRDLVEKHGGSMTFRPKGAGGDWVLQLEGKTLTVECRSNKANELDRLYKAKVDRPETWEDYAPDAPLVPRAFWGLIRLFDKAE